MEPPRRPHVARRAQSKGDAMDASSFEMSGAPRPCRTANQPANLEHTDSAYGSGRSRDIWDTSETRLQVELAECVETKTVTTTTTTKRLYPPLLIRPPRSLQSLSSKEYPLAAKPTPQILTNFSYVLGDQLIRLHGVSPTAMAAEEDLGDPQAPNDLERWGSKAMSLEQPDIQPAAKNSRHLDATDHDGSPCIPKTMSPRSFSLSLSQHIQPLSVPRQRRENRRKSQIPDMTSTSFFNSRVLDHDHFKRSTSQPQAENEESHEGSSDVQSVSTPPISAIPVSFPLAVATPPIVESDHGSFDHLSYALHDSSSDHLPQESTTPKNGSLPSPSLSPTLAASRLERAHYAVDNEDSVALRNDPGALRSRPWYSATKLHNIGNPQDDYAKSATTVMDSQTMLDTFDAMPSQMKSFMIYQFLRRCTRQTLHVVADVVSPALKCDYLEDLPLELSLHILSFLNHKDLCRAAQVSKRWRSIIDSNEIGWKELLDRDQYILPHGEVERAIVQGWGWQDPTGEEACELDLRQTGTLPSKLAELTSLAGRDMPDEASPQVCPRMPSKRKRVPGNLHNERLKRQTHDPADRLQVRGLRKSSLAAESIQKSEGPLAAATAAALAIPDPQIGLPSLTRLHVFKSLYRRHYMFRKSWATHRTQPHHMAFPAHPRHVITCLQFDDDKILTGSDDTFIHVYDTRTGKLRKRLEGHEGGVWALQYEGNVLVSGSTDRSVRVWDIEKGLCTQVFHGHTSTVRCLQILMPSHTGKSIGGRPILMPEQPLIITGSRDSQLRIWKLPEPGAKRYNQTTPPLLESDCPYFIRVLQGHSHSVRAIAAHQDTLVSGSYDHTVRVWKISNGKTLFQLRGHNQKVYSVVIDSARKRCISGSMDNSVKIWSLESGACLHTLEGHSSLVGLLDLKEDRLVSAAADSTLRVWDPEDGTCKAALTAHTGAITCFQHDGSKVISGSDRTLKMWNVKTGECMQDLLTDLSGVWQVKFDHRRCVAAVQRDGLTSIEVLDFGASRDGIAKSERGRRILLPPSEVDLIMDASRDDDEFAV